MLQNYALITTMAKCLIALWSIILSGVSGTMISAFYYSSESSWSVVLPSAAGLRRPACNRAGHPGEPTRSVWRSRSAIPRTTIGHLPEWDQLDTLRRTLRDLLCKLSTGQGSPRGMSRQYGLLCRNVSTAGPSTCSSSYPSLTHVVASWQYLDTAEPAAMARHARSLIHVALSSSSSARCRRSTRSE